MGKSVRDLLDDIRDVDYGPKMMALPEEQRKFVNIVVMQASTNFAAAAEEAGLAEPGRSSVLKGYQLSHSKRIQEAMREETHRRIEVGAVIGIAGLVKMAADPTHPKQFQACESLADRGGYSKEHRLHVQHEHRDLTGDALMARIRELAKKHGLDPERLLRGERPQREPPTREGAANAPIYRVCGEASERSGGADDSNSAEQRHDDDTERVGTLP